MKAKPVKKSPTLEQVGKAAPHLFFVKHGGKQASEEPALHPGGEAEETRMRRPMHPGLSSFLYVLSGFGLLALFPLLSILGFALVGGWGAISGVGLAAFLMTWAVCWFFLS